MTIEQYKRAEEILIECRALAEAKSSMGNMFNGVIPKEQKAWFDKIGAEAQIKIDKLQDEFEAL